MNKSISVKNILILVGSFIALVAVLLGIYVVVLRYTKNTYKSKNYVYKVPKIIKDVTDDESIAGLYDGNVYQIRGTNLITIAEVPDLHMTADAFAEFDANNFIGDGNTDARWEHVKSGDTSIAKVWYTMRTQGEKYRYVEYIVRGESRILMISGNLQEAKADRYEKYLLEIAESTVSVPESPHVFDYENDGDFRIYRDDIQTIRFPNDMICETKKNDAREWIVISRYMSDDYKRALSTVTVIPVELGDSTLEEVGKEAAAKKESTLETATFPHATTAYKYQSHSMMAQVSIVNVSYYIEVQGEYYCISYKYPEGDTEYEKTMKNIAESWELIE